DAGATRLDRLPECLGVLRSLLGLFGRFGVDVADPVVRGQLRTTGEATVRALVADQSLSQDERPEEGDHDADDERDPRRSDLDHEQLLQGTENVETSAAQCSEARDGARGR